MRIRKKYTQEEKCAARKKAITRVKEEYFLDFKSMYTWIFWGIVVSSWMVWMLLISVEVILILILDIFAIDGIAYIFSYIKYLRNPYYN